MFASVNLAQPANPAQILSASEGKEKITRPDWSGEDCQVLEHFSQSGPMILVALTENASPAAKRKAAAQVARLSARLKLEGIILNDGLGFMAREVGEAFGLLAWQPGILKGSGSKAPDLKDLLVWSENSDHRRELDYGLSLAQSANLARTLAFTPPNVATPLAIADQAKEMAEKVGLTCQVVQGDDLEKENLTGLISVGKASENQPCLIILRWTPPGSEGQAPVVLLGKTITYDTGGLSLKVNNGMKGMKGDKSGGCAVLGTMHAVATLLKPSFPVVGLLVAAENSVSANAYRPDDVITYRNGVTVEVTNTDAEGRLVLADGLIWASEVEKAKEIIDLATLTGGVITALGKTFAGYFCENAELRARLEEAGQATGERIWRLPLDQEYRDMMKSDIADLINSNPNRLAHPIQGAAFLAAFVKEGTPWAHIDIAGTANTDKDQDAYVPGPTGYGVRLLAEYLGRG
ncbi:MAG: leucyl aminopeptidase family protein [Fimbriimonadaceae bacterium]|jgi:leucyl aminopeptidase|nr:leucyl aminopeptidase family protein [Fimbriimonadaceae bacterium]